MSTAAALAVAAALAGCGTTTYFAGRTLPPSGLTNRVLVTIQNPSVFSAGGAEIMDAFYDIRYQYNDINKTFSVSGFSSNLPTTIQSMPNEQLGAVYGSGDGSLVLVNYAGEKTSGSISGINGKSSSIFITRNQSYIFAANQTSNVLTVVDQEGGNSSTPLSLPGVYRVSVNPGGSVALAFVQNSNNIYFPMKLTSAQSVNYSGGPGSWPKAAVDCEPFNLPGWCLFQATDPKTGSALTFDRPVKAVFSADGGTAYVLSCGPECGGSKASITPIPVAPMIFLLGQAAGLLPTQAAIANCGPGNQTSSCTIPIPGGASNALVNGSALYVVGQAPQQVQGQTLFTGGLTAVDFSKSPAVVSAAVSISDGAPGAPSRMVVADDNTLWVGMTNCNNGVRAATGQSYGCLTMLNVANATAPTVTLLEPYIGNATGIAAVAGLHKIYTAEGGQVYIYKTTDGSAIDNQYVTVTGLATDVVYMDADSDSNNTVY
jgi:hypothetical protein